MHTPIGRVLAMVAKLYLGVVTRKLEHLEVERNFYPLVVISGGKGTITQQDLASSCQIDKVTMVRQLDYLSDKGFVERVRNTEDRREHFLRLTPKGEASIACINKAYEEINEAALEGISAEERDIFFRCLARIEQNLNQLPGNVMDVKYTRIGKKKNS